MFDIEINGEFDSSWASMSAAEQHGEGLANTEMAYVELLDQDGAVIGHWDGRLRRIA